MVEELFAKGGEDKDKLSLENSRGNEECIQVLKEQPELSWKDQESNLVNSELVHLPRRPTR